MKQRKQYCKLLLDGEVVISSHDSYKTVYRKAKAIFDHVPWINRLTILYYGERVIMERE